MIWRAWFVVLSVVAFGACSKSAKPLDELEKTAAAMKKVDPEAEKPDPKAGGAESPATQVQEAIAEYKAGKMEDAVTRLQMLRAMPSMTPEQRMALQDSVAAVMSEVYEQAQKGDQRAIAAVAAYERMQNRR